MFDLFGDLGTAAKFFIAFAIVLALIAITAWLVRRFAANRLGGAAARGRQPRLAVIDAASVDGRRRLILIRRDNIEHLLMIGGPTDVVVEQNIVRAAARDLGREQPRVGTPNDSLPRAVPLGDVGAWPLQPEPMPVPAPTPRSYRPAVTEEPWVAPETGTRPRNTDNAGGMSNDFAAKLGADLGAPPARTAPPLAAPPRDIAPPVESPVQASQNDHNLAEMAQRLEAALRRPGAAQPHTPATDPLAAALSAPQASSAPRDIKPMRQEPKFEPKAEPKPVVGKGAYDSLEQEMASLLGRPSGKT